LPKFYRGKLSKTLTAFVDECLTTGVQEQLDLLEELAVARGLTGEVGMLYMAACEMPESTPEEREKKFAAIELLRPAMKDWVGWVADMTERAARVRATVRDKISATDLQQVLAQVVRIAHDTLEPGHLSGRDAAVALERALSEQIVLPSRDGENGTDIAPGDDVRDMDDSIPVA
jgi:hypothetical protein